MTKQPHLGAFMRPVGIHTAWWRVPGAFPDGNSKRDNLTVRQLAQFAGGYGGLEMVGTAGEIADTMQEWLETEASDGFNVMFPTVPAGLDDFMNLVVPELQRRGVFRREYEGTTLREHLGLPRPVSRFFPEKPPT